VLRGQTIVRIAALGRLAGLLVAAILGTSAVNCASEPKPRPTVLDPSNPDAPESPPLRAPSLNTDSVRLPSPTVDSVDASADASAPPAHTHETKPRAGGSK